jgi:uncharacterized membrane protein YdfJ with MMPL/SSD domain
VSDTTTGPSERAAPTVSSRVARAIVWLRFLILPAWIVGLLLAMTHLPSVFDSESGELGSLLPHSSSALEVERKAVQTFGLPLLSRTMVVAHRSGGFSPEQLSGASHYIATTDQREGPDALRAAPLADAPGLLAARDAGTTLVVYLYIDPAIGEADSQTAAERFATGLKRVTGADATEVTGALPATRAETEIANRDILWVELATVLLVVAILAFYFRSLAVPPLGLGTVAIAYLCADRILGWIAERYASMRERRTASVPG